MKRREALVSIALSGTTILLPGCAPSPAPADTLSERDIQALLRLQGVTLEPGEGAHVLTSFMSSRFTTAVDPTVQPQSDFDPEVDS